MFTISVGVAIHFIAKIEAELRICINRPSRTTYELPKGISIPTVPNNTENTCYYNSAIGRFEN